MKLPYISRKASLFAALLLMGLDATAASTAITRLRAVQPGVRWDAKSAKSGDFNCDGAPDTAMVGYGKRGVPWIGMVPNQVGEQPTVLKFRLGNGSQDALCVTPARIVTAPIECSDRESGPLPGCRPVPGCLALSLRDDRCDDIHFYWDSDQQKLVWWRH